jgi:hypothetical protein
MNKKKDSLQEQGMDPQLKTSANRIFFSSVFVISSQSILAGLK